MVAGYWALPWVPLFEFWREAEPTLALLATPWRDWEVLAWDCFALPAAPDCLLILTPARLAAARLAEYSWARVRELELDFCEPPR